MGKRKPLDKYKLSSVQKPLCSTQTLFYVVPLSLTQPRSMKSDIGGGSCERSGGYGEATSALADPTAVLE